MTISGLPLHKMSQNIFRIVGIKIRRNMIVGTLMIMFGTALVLHKISSLDQNNLENITENMKVLGNSPGAFNISVSNPLVGGNYFLIPKICTALENVIGYKDMVDFGAGLGQYGKCFTRDFSYYLHSGPELAEPAKKFYNYFRKQMNKENLQEKPQVIKSWEGYDGSSNIETITNHWVKFLDLSKSFYLGKEYDWVMSLEVGEHIPAEFEDVFIDNLIRHAKVGVILSWAVLGQDGHNHINNHSNKYVVDKMKKKGLAHDRSSEAMVRNNKDLLYFKNSLMVFRTRKN